MTEIFSKIEQLQKNTNQIRKQLSKLSNKFDTKQKFTVYEHTIQNDSFRKNQKNLQHKHMTDEQFHQYAERKLHKNLESGFIKEAGTQKYKKINQPGQYVKNNLGVIVYKVLNAA